MHDPQNPRHKDEVTQTIDYLSLKKLPDKYYSRIESATYEQLVEFRNQPYFTGQSLGSLYAEHIEQGARVPTYVHAACRAISLVRRVKVALALPPFSAAAAKARRNI